MLRWICLVTLLAACGGARPAPSTLPAIDWAAHGLASDGCFMVRDLASGDERVSDEARCTTPRRPHSTFKIPNSLIGLDLGVLDGPDAVMAWDRETYPAEDYWPEEWKQDLPLRRAIAVSAVPAYRRLATLIGEERMQAALDRLGYGNRDLSGGLDQFWLRGGLRISAREQLDFVTRLVRGELPASKAAQATVREILLRDERAGARIFGKTGSGPVEDSPLGFDGPLLGWLVGWIEQGDRILVYAMWVEAERYEGVRDRREQVVDSVFAALGVTR
jgi:beta-lactamase class D